MISNAIRLTIASEGGTEQDHGQPWILSYRLVGNDPTVYKAYFRDEVSAKRVEKFIIDSTIDESLGIINRSQQL